VRFAGVKVATDGDGHAFEVTAHLAGLDPGAVSVELYAEASDGSAPVRRKMMPLTKPAGCTYQTRVSGVRPAGDYAVRVVPSHDGVAVPLEEARIRWLR